MLLACCIFAAVSAAGCRTEKIPGGRLVIRNDILDKQFNTFTIDELLTSSGRGDFRKTLRPGDEITVPQKHVLSLRFTRRYEDHSKVYIVRCPEELDEEVRMKLIDVHLNRLSGGCVLSRRGEIRGGTTVWEKEK